MIERLASVLRQKKAVHTLLPDVLTELRKLVPVEAFRVDVEDQGRLWSRIVKPGAEPQRPGLGAVPRLGSREVDSNREAEGGFETTLILGIGEPAGRLVVRRAERPFDAEELQRLRSVADLFSLALRARPLDPPARVRHPFEEGPLI